MNWNNLIENAIYIALISLALIVNNYVIIGRFEGMVNEAIAKETTSIKNEFRTEIKKLKNRNGEVVLETEPILENTIGQTDDSLTAPNQKPTKKPGLLKRIFGSKQNKD